MQGLDFLYFLYVEFLEVQTWSLTLFHPLISARKEAAIKNTQVADSNLQDYKTENPAGSIYIYSELCSNEKPRDSNAYITHTRVSKVSTFAHVPVEKKMGGEGGTCFEGARPQIQCWDHARNRSKKENPNGMKTVMSFFGRS